MLISAAKTLYPLAERYKECLPLPQARSNAVPLLFGIFSIQYLTQFDILFIVSIVIIIYITIFSKCYYNNKKKMILFDLKCENEHQFEAWFSSSKNYDEQIKEKLVICPFCNSSKVSKSLMAPNINIGKSANDKNKDVNIMQKKIEKKIRKFKKFIENNTENVGKNFAEEARKIYYGEKNLGQLEENQLKVKLRN